MSLPVYGYEFIFRMPILNEQMCVASAIIRNISLIADWMTVGMIALSRCIYTTRFTRLSFIEKYGKSFVIGIWIYSILVYFTVYFTTKSSIGYDCIVGRCDFIHVEDSYFLLNYVFALPCLLILICYSYMGWYFYKNHRQRRHTVIGTTNFKEFSF